MSWVSVAEKDVATTVEGFFADLLSHPIIANNPDAVKLVNDTKAQVATATTTVSTAANALTAQAVAAEGPLETDLRGALQTGVDIYLSSAFGPFGELAEVPANAALNLAESWVHNEVAGLFSNARANVAAAAKPS